METEMESSSTSRFKLWSELVLEEYTEKFVIKSVESPDQGFSISRLDGNIDKLDSDDPSGSPSKVSTIYGVAGTIRLLAGTYVLVITSRKEVGTYLGFPVFLVTSMKFLSCNGASRFLTSQELAEEMQAGNRMGEQTNLEAEINAVKLNSSGELQGDPRFVWNRNLLEELIENKSEVVERHFNDILQRYRGCIAVDLTDKHGDEGLLSMAYAEEMQKLMQKLPNVRYFLLDPEGKVLAEQGGVVRSNCIDCLDRTNVTQSYLGQKSLNSQLQRVGAISSTECISMFSEDFESFKTLWVDHGDEISLEYSGTHALKRDLVRYGKQTMAGIIKDGMSALSRYYLNNFQDGVRQYLPVASALLVGGLTVTSITLNQAGRQAHQYLSSVICAGVTAGVMAVIKSNGRQICSRPRLCGLL
ncbi:UNVERIFIED_CONTAM: Phosphoinositide phosphatase SAC8 [Sesamum latifolium]|uniref:Phosphoinositide phosphatase SAC8 n=1 Tax=Sesamum latifolium TaxID=2727402 RepID=A0AAW2XAX4_9LAMI